MVISRDLRGKVSARIMEGAGYVQVSRELGLSAGAAHNIIQEEKRKTPDFDELRRLNVSLKKNNMSVYDSRKASELRERLDGFGLRLEDLGDYLSLTEEFLSENGVGPEFVGLALQFKRLSEESGMSCGDFVQDYQRKQAEAKKSQAVTVREQSRLEAVKVELKEAEKALLEVSVKVKRFMSLQAGLRKIGSVKLAKVVQFVPEFEALDYDAGEVKSFGALKLKLKELNINPDKLEEELVERGSLLYQNQLIVDAIEEGRLQSQALTTLNGALLGQNSTLSTVDQIIKTGCMPMPCRFCGTPIGVRLESDYFYRRMIEQNMFLAPVCPACGSTQQFTGWDIVFQVAALITPRSIPILL